MLDFDIKDAAKIAVDEAAKTLVPALAAALDPILDKAVQSIRAALAEETALLLKGMEGLTVTVSRKEPGQ